MNELNSTQQAIGWLLLCQCKQLDPCCVQQIAVATGNDGGFNNPIFRAALLCILSQWFDQQREQSVAQTLVPSGAVITGSVARANTYTTQTQAACGTPKLATLLYALISPGVGRNFVDYCMGLRSSHAP